MNDALEKFSILLALFSKIFLKYHFFSSHFTKFLLLLLIIIKYDKLRKSNKLNIRFLNVMI